MPTVGEPGVSREPARSLMIGLTICVSLYILISCWLCTVVSSLDALGDVLRLLIHEVLLEDQVRPHCTLLWSLGGNHPVLIFLMIFRGNGDCY